MDQFEKNKTKSNQSKKLLSREKQVKKGSAVHGGKAGDAEEVFIVDDDSSIKQ